MNLHFKDVPCPCFWCQCNGQEATGHRITRYWCDDSPPSPECQAAMDEVIKDVVRDAQRTTGDA